VPAAGSWIGFGFLAIGVGGLMAGAAMGLYRQKRWGAALFGLLVVLGSINHMANVIARYPSLSLQQPGTAASALVSLLLAILITLALIYLTLVLWRRSQ
jgi:hypothetical protein